MTGELDLAAWIAFDRAHPAPTFFARPAWALALADSMPNLRPSPLWVLHEGERYVVPTVRARTRMPFREHLAFPLGGYTCVLDSQGRAAEPLVAARVLDELARSCDRLTVIPWPLAQPAAWNARAGSPMETAVIDCSGGYERALAGVRGVTRRMAGQAERRGVICERGTIEELDAYYEMLHAASLGWGRTEPTISRSLLHAVFARGGNDAQVWFARAEGAIIGGGVILYGAQELFFWSAAMRREYGRLRPSNALNLTLIAQACARGVHWYNLGASEGLEGVARFKSDLGAHAIEYCSWSIEGAGYSLFHRARQRITVRKGVLT